MARFLGAPVLDEQFVSIYVRFTDDTAKDLLSQLTHASLQPAPDAAFTSLWLPQLERLNPTHSLRILFEKYTSSPRHFFHAGIDGIVTGPFDVLMDDMRHENFMLGQPRVVNKIGYYDVWTSYTLPGFTPPSVLFHAVALPDQHHHSNRITPSKAMPPSISAPHCRRRRPLLPTFARPQGRFHFHVLRRNSRLLPKRGLTGSNCATAEMIPSASSSPASPAPELPSLCIFTIAATSSKIPAIPSSTLASAKAGILITVTLPNSLFMT